MFPKAEPGPASQGSGSSRRKKSKRTPKATNRSFSATGGGLQSPQESSFGLFSTTIFVRCIEDQWNNFFAWRYRFDTEAIPIDPSLLLGNDTQLAVLYKEAVAGKDNLKSTTVRFTEADLKIITSLQDKLGLGMVQIIRLAIRRLAEIENVLTAPSPRKKG